MNIVNNSVYECWKSDKIQHTINGLDHEVQLQLRKRSYNFDKANKVLSQLEQQNQKAKETDNHSEKLEDSNPEVSESSQVGQELGLCDIEMGAETSPESADSTTVTNGESRLSNEKAVGPVFDNIKLRKEEIKGVIL